MTELMAVGGQFSYTMRFSDRYASVRSDTANARATPCWKPTRFTTRSRTCLSGQTFLGGIFDYAEKKDRLEEVTRELEDPNVWNDPDYAQKLGKERASLEAIVATIDELEQGLGDSRTACKPR